MTWYLIIMAVGAALLAILSGLWVAVGLIKELTGRSAFRQDTQKKTG